MGTLEKRIAALEETAPAEPVTVIIGGLDRDDVTCVRAAFGHGEREWRRQGGETVADFRARAAADAERHGIKVLVEADHE
jgi:sugar phosphate isomerase/epimerase